jgi:hypothetical protein
VQDEHGTEHHRRDQHPELVALPRGKDQRPGQATTQHHQLAQHGQAVDADLAGHDLGGISGLPLVQERRARGEQAQDEDRARPACIGAQRFQQHQRHQQRQHQVIGQQPVEEVSCHGLPR